MKTLILGDLTIEDAKEDGGFKLYNEHNVQLCHVYASGELELLCWLMIKHASKMKEIEKKLDAELRDNSTKPDISPAPLDYMCIDCKEVVHKGNAHYCKQKPDNPPREVK